MEHVYEFTAKHGGYVELARFGTDRALEMIFGTRPIWSNFHVQSDPGYHPDTKEIDTAKHVHFFVNLVHVPNTELIFKMGAEVTVIPARDGGWEIRYVRIFLHHHRIDDSWTDDSIDISLPEGIETINDFSTYKHEVDDPRHSADRFIEPYRSRFPIPAVAEAA